MVQELTAFFFWNRTKLADQDLANATLKFMASKGWLKMEKNDLTIRLPKAGGNTDQITIKKTDAGPGRVIIEGGPHDEGEKNGESN